MYVILNRIVISLLFIASLNSCLSNDNYKKSENGIESEDSIMIRKATGYAYYSDYESENYKPKWEAEIQGEWLNYSLSKKYKDFKIEYKIFEKNSSDCLMTETITIYDKVLEPYEKEIIGLRLKGLDNLNKNLQYRIEWRMISCISE